MWRWRGRGSEELGEETVVCRTRIGGFSFEGILQPRSYIHPKEFHRFHRPDNQRESAQAAREVWSSRLQGDSALMKAARLRAPIREFRARLKIFACGSWQRPAGSGSSRGYRWGAAKAYVRPRSSRRIAGGGRRQARQRGGYVRLYASIRSDLASTTSISWRRANSYFPSLHLPNRKGSIPGPLGCGMRWSSRIVWNLSSAGAIRNEHSTSPR